MVKISTLGDFDITVEDISIMDYIGNSQKLMKLFKYFLIHRDIKLLPETIIEDLWIDEDFINPINMIRTQISRLRKILDIDEIEIETFFNIKYIGGYYVFTLSDACIVDFIEFENILEKDCISIKKDIEKKHTDLKDIILLYKGALLGEVGDEDWIIPIRNRFQRLYVKALTCYIDCLKEKRMCTEIIEICEIAINIEPYEEIIHFNFMQALVNLNQYSYALIHYEFFTKRLYNDLKVAPSKKLAGLYQNIKSQESNQVLSMDLNKIDDEMIEEFDFGGVIFCDIKHFKFLYNYERRNKDRRIDKDRGRGIGVITIYSKSYNQLTDKEIKKAMDLLGYTLFKTIRHGDVVSKWNNSQMLILLYGLRNQDRGIIIDRIKHNFDQAKDDKDLSLNIKLKVL